MFSLAFYAFQARDSKEHIARTLRDGQGQARPDLGGGGLLCEARGAQVRLQRALRRPGKITNNVSSWSNPNFVSVLPTVRPRHGRSTTHGEFIADSPHSLTRTI